MLCLVPVRHIMHFHVYNISPNWVGTFYLLFLPLLFGERGWDKGTKALHSYKGMVPDLFNGTQTMNTLHGSSK